MICHSSCSKKFHILLLLIVAAVVIWSAIHPHDVFTWILESLPVLIAAPVLLLTYRRFPLTSLVYVLIAIHSVILLIGAHYTYAEVPLFNWARDYFELSRNHYDRVGHFAQGFVPAMIARELLLRTSPLKAGTWLFVIVLLSCLGISAIYELLEWAVAEFSGAAAAAFLGTQGDHWDTQKDMFLAGIGACLALILLSKPHDRLLERKNT